MVVLLVLVLILLYLCTGIGSGMATRTGIASLLIQSIVNPALCIFTSFNLAPSEYQYFRTMLSEQSLSYLVHTHTGILTQPLEAFLRNIDPGTPPDDL